MLKAQHLIGLGLVLSQKAFAINPKVIFYSDTHFMGTGINSYSQSAEGFFMKEADKYCAQAKQQVDTISNVTVQIQGGFILNKTGSGIDSTTAVTNPHLIYTALVSCK